MRIILLLAFSLLLTGPITATEARAVLLKSFAASEPAGEQLGRVRTFMQGRIERWEVTLNDTDGIIEAYMKDDLNRWTFSVGSLEGEVNTVMTDEFSNWEITIGTRVYRLHTWMKGSWNRWEVKGGDMKGVTTFRTLYGYSWDKWEMQSDSAHCDITTYMNESWDDWEIKGDLAKMSAGERAAAVFMPVFVSRIYRPKIAK